MFLAGFDAPGFDLRRFWRVGWWIGHGGMCLFKLRSRSLGWICDLWRDGRRRLHSARLKRRRRRFPGLVTSDKRLLNLDEAAFVLAFNEAALSPVHPVPIIRARSAPLGIPCEKQSAARLTAKK